MAYCNELWAECKRKCRLNAEDIELAKRLGLNPRSLIKNIPNSSEPWKAPVKIWLREIEAGRNKKALQKQTHREKTKPADAVHYINAIAKAASISEIKTAVTSLKGFADANPEFREQLRRQLTELIVESGKEYLCPLPESKNNVVFIPPDVAPLMMIPCCVPLGGSNKEFYIGGSNKEFYKGLAKLSARCDEFIEPLEDIISTEEMIMVLDSAQKKFGALDIIAPVKPLNILSFNNSHKVFNCECGVGDTPSGRESVIFVYHPREAAPCDRVFIFAHEIGHALHIALTGNVLVIPDGFDGFNEKLEIVLNNVAEKQEAFADVAAFAILNSGNLKKHLPHPFSKPMLDCFERYINGVTRNYKAP